jgi:general secretion pathway protein F
MPDYNYIALDQQGGKVKGSLSAASKAAAMDSLTNQQIFATRITECRVGSGSGESFSLNPFNSRISSREIILMIRRLATLISADIPLVESLSAICGQVESDAFKRVLTQVRDDVKGGLSLSQALSKHDNIFPELMISMVQVGETGGILDSVLEQLADFSERDQEIKSEVKAALAYPSIVLALAIATVTLLMTVFVPKLNTMFGSMAASLPGPTRLLMNISEYATTWGIWVALLLAAIATGGYFWSKKPEGREALDSIKLRLPLVGSLVRKTSIARFARSLGALARGGVPLIEALDVVKKVLNSPTMTLAIERVQERVRKGDSMAQGLTHETMFPEMVRYMIAAGEDSGKMDNMLFKVADIYEMETRYAVRIMLSILPPLLILLVAAIVGFIALAMLMPIFQINQMIS